MNTFRLIVFFASTLLFPGPSTANCGSICAGRCSVIGGPSVGSNTWEMCVSQCEMVCSSEAPAKPRSRFGAIAVGSEYAATARLGPDATDAERRVVEHCNANSKGTKDCWLAASYKDSCSAVAVGSDGRADRFHVIGSGGVNTGKRTVAEAEQAVLTSCRSAGHTGCKIRISSCAHAMTAEEEAEAAVIGLAAAAVVIGIVYEIFQGKSGHAPVVAQTVVDKGRIYGACKRTVAAAHIHPTLMTTGDVHDACTCTANLYHQSKVARSRHILEAFMPFEDGEIFDTERLDGFIRQLPKNDPLREDFHQAALKQQQCTQYVGNDAFWGGARRRTKAPLPITEGPARYAAPVVSLQ